MGKLTDPKWWTGQTDDQKARRAQARADLKDLGDHVREQTAETRAAIGEQVGAMREDVAASNARHEVKRAESREKSAAERQAILDDREGRSLGGWGRKRG